MKFEVKNWEVGRNKFVKNGVGFTPVLPRFYPASKNYD